MVKDETGNVYLSQEDLLSIFSARLESFPGEIDQLKKPQEGSIVGLDGKKNVVPSDPVEVARHEGMQKMLEGIFSMINITDD
jgi:hypothetical protein